MGKTLVSIGPDNFKVIKMNWIQAEQVLITWQ